MSLDVEILYRFEHLSTCSLFCGVITISMDMRILFRDIQERYRTLIVYGIAVSEEELALVGGLEQQWKDLSIEGRQVDKSLIKVKKKFTLV